MISSEQLQELQEACKHLNPEALGKFAVMSVVFIVSPTATGKTTILEKVLEKTQNPSQWNIVGTISTRSSRGNKETPGYKTGLTIEDFFDQANQGLLVNVVLSGKHLYGTNIDSYRAANNLFPVLPGSISDIEQQGFAKTEKIFIVVSIEDWQVWFMEREDDSNIERRLTEAIESCRFAIENGPSLHFVLNSSKEGGLDTAARTIMEISADGRSATELEQNYALHLVQEMLDFARNKLTEYRRTHGS